MKHIDIKEIFTNEAFIGNEAVVCGWVRTARDSKNVGFLALNDGTTLNHLQIVIDKTSGIVVDAEATKLGASVKVIGTVVKNENNGTVEINAGEIVLLGKCPPDYPLQKKFQKLETLRENPHIRVEQTHSTQFSEYAPLWQLPFTDISRTEAMFMFTHPLSQAPTARVQVKCSR